MISKFLLGVEIAKHSFIKPFEHHYASGEPSLQREALLTFVLAVLAFLQIRPHLVSALYDAYPDSYPGLVLLLLRVSVGVLFLIHGYPKLCHLQQWADSIQKPVFLCFLSAWSMLCSGVCLIVGFMTLLATLPLLASMLFAIFIKMAGGKPFVAIDPYLIPNDHYKGTLGKGEPPSWEKAFMFCVMLIVIAVLGPGRYSLDALIFGQ